MKAILLLLLLLLFSCDTFERDKSVSLIINEWVVKNRSTLILSPDGEQKDWVEVYNAGGSTISLSNFYLSDNRENYKKYRFEGIELQPGEFHTVWGGSGEFHSPVYMGFSFSLDENKGEGIYLFDSSGTLIDSVNTISVVNAYDCDTCSYGRIPDGAMHFTVEQSATPGNSNNYNRRLNEQ